MLQRYGFDEAEFLGRQRRVSDGSLSLLSNIVPGELQAPESDAWTDLPRRESPEGKDATACGELAIARGELGVIILNGGMATRFGGIVKGTVEALPGRSFLCLKVQSALRVARQTGGQVRIFLMNSFATDEDTHKHFAEHKDFGAPEGTVHSYTQGISLRMLPNGEIFLDEDGYPSCHSPGHGDCTSYFRAASHLARFLDSGGKYLFISNVDNLTANLDPLILGTHILSGRELTAEVAPKWPGDHGGAPALVDGELWIVEGFRFPEDFDQDQIPVFNTNTFTVNADKLDRDFELTDCYVEKTVADRPVVQIETLIGELTRFLPTQYLRVKRTGGAGRFFPIKTPEDLADAREDLQRLIS